MRSFVCLTLFGLLLVQAALSLDKQKDCKCRIQAKKRIVGGREADSAAYPWQVSIMLKEETIPVPSFLRKLVPDSIKIAKHLCGGVILNQDWILTAESCLPYKAEFEGRTARYLKVGLGDNDLVKIYEDQKYVEAEKVIFPRNFRKGILFPIGNDDITLIKLKKPLQFSKTIQPACLPSIDQEVYEGVLKVTGWGSVNPLVLDQYDRVTENVSISRYLKEADVFDQSSTLDLCKVEKAHRRNTLCTINAKTNETACKEDIGGPLHYTKAGKAFVVGMTKYQPKEDLENKRYRTCTGQTAYTRVAEYLDWIKSELDDDYCG